MSCIKQKTFFAFAEDVGFFVATDEGGVVSYFTSNKKSNNIFYNIHNFKLKTSTTLCFPMQIL